MSNEQTTMTAMTAGRASPSGIRTGYTDQGSAPIQALVGAPNQGGRQTYIGTHQNTPPGPPVWSWNNYDFLYNAYFERGGFFDGTALVKSIVETDDQYFERRRVAYYENYFRPIIDATYLPVFSSPVERKTEVAGQLDADGKAAPFWFAFCGDVDQRGNCIEDFTKKTIKHARILGIVFVVMDNFPVIPELQDDALENRKFPFVAMRMPQQIEPELLIIDDFGNILEIAFVEPKENGEDRWKKWTAYHTVKLAKDKNGRFFEVPSTLFKHNLGKCPVIPVFSSESDDGSIMPFPPYYSIARCNWALYNVCSAQMRLLRSQMFSILCAPKMEGGFATGVNHGFELPADNTQTGEKYPTPFYLSPPVGPYGAISETITKMREDLYRLAGQEGVSGVQQQKSGIAKAFDFSAQEWVLKDTAKMAARAECKIAELFKLYTGETFDYYAQYTSDFKPAYSDDRITRDATVLEKVSTLSTPYNPIISAALRDLLETFYMGEENDKMEIIEWIKKNTATVDDPSQSQIPSQGEIAGKGVEELIKTVMAKFNGKGKPKDKNAGDVIDKPKDGGAKDGKGDAPDKGGEK